LEIGISKTSGGFKLQRNVNPDGMMILTDWNQPVEKGGLRFTNLYLG
jgi:hypothetical protein